MDIAKYTLEDWLLWEVLPEDLKIENEDLNYTRSVDKEYKRGEYKYGFMDWYNGLLSEDNIEVLSEKGELSYGAILNISVLQALAYLKMLNNGLWGRIYAIEESFKHSFMKKEMLEDEVNKVKAEIEEFKSAYPETYANALKGIDERTDLSSDEVINTLSSKRHYYMGPDTAYEIIIKAKYLNWLVWFNSPDSDKLPEPTFKEEAKPFLQDLLSLNKQINDYKEDAEPYQYTLQRQAGYPISTNTSLVKQSGNKERTLLDRRKSYTWLSNSKTELPELYQRLKDSQLIHPDTKEEHFKAIFTCKPLQEIEPINWSGAKNLLAYFIDSIHSNKLIHSNTEQWSVARRCFIGGKNLAQSKDRYLDNIKNNGKPTDYLIIDELLKGL
jgi:hypothetical protein